MQCKGTICRSVKTGERKTGERLNQRSMFNCYNKIYDISTTVTVSRFQTILIITRFMRVY